MPIYEHVELTAIPGSLALAIPSNHCPGGIQIKFSFPGKTVLHTGDFRLHRAMLVEKHLRPGCIDELILDCTFCSPRFSVFPTKDKCVAYAVRLISDRGRGKQVYIEADMLGTEPFIAAMSKLLLPGERIFCMNEKRRAELEVLGFGKYITDEGIGNILLLALARWSDGASRLGWQRPDRVSVSSRISF